ncbi:mixed lineage kinase domain-like protein [Scleropages formosus]|uniref:Mixed lineage kinase domain like pseudokinase n=1 Tax=Scleropages formosus TaxID=113540 RepID=A0A8C9RBL1_SCLFO|nr:mixed lineage kinase domain-like protein [Scleropages formosus]XP_018618692.1 mixed lineage kinase domain-like protein [Scleropages formosus]XP_018618693.1 mixed lineage kinase domain-like protein [Scleropages formosus]
MDLVDPILSIAEKLHSLCGEVKANKKRCARLGMRVAALVELVKAVKVKGPGGHPELVHRGLQELRLTLESTRKVVEKYASTGCFRRIIKAYDLGEEFEVLNERLNDSAQLLSLALQADQKEMLQRVFKETTRRTEDNEDRESDRRELEKLLQSLAQETKESVDAVHAIHEMVDSTKSDVKDIKAMLTSLKRPSIHQMDIREIKPEELTYDVPKMPFMKTATSEMYKGEYNKFTVAIKRFTCPMSHSPEQVRTVFKKEIETMRRFESPNILRMFGICVQDENGPDPNYLIVMEFCEKGNLRDVLDGQSKLSWERRARMSLDAAQGIYRLHQSEEKFKVHGSISSQKFLVDSGYRVKLGGFELAKTETSLRKNKDRKSSSIHYCSPQQLENVNHPYDKACEIYSFGIVLWEVATRQIPYKGCSSKEVYHKVCEEKTMEPLPSDCPQIFASLISASRAYDPFHRPTAGVLVDKLRKVVQELEED